MPIGPIAKLALEELARSCTALEPAKLTPTESTIVLRLLNEPALRHELADEIQAAREIVRKHAEFGE